MRMVWMESNWRVTRDNLDCQLKVIPSVGHFEILEMKRSQSVQINMWLNAKE